MTSSSEALLTPTEVAAWLKKSKSWVYGAASSGQLPVTRIGRDLRFRREDLERWLSARTQRTAPATLKEES